MNLLIVEDSPTMRRVIGNTVKKFMECDVTEAEHGIDALQVLKNKDIDLILLDWMMPVMDGIEFITALRKMKKFKHHPVLMITTKASKKEIILAISSGVNDFAVKPINAPVLEAKIKNVLYRNSKEN